MKQGFAHKLSLKAPVNVTWEITKRCNLQCRHCLSADLSELSDGELDFQECRALIDDLHRMEVFQINFGGGEPFLREDFLDILEYAEAQGITLCVSTNGTLLRESLVEKLKRLRLLYIQVSLDGATAEMNDSIRGLGTHEQAIAAIQLLGRHGFTHLSINTVVTRLNFNEILPLYELGRGYGVKTRLSRYRPAGEGKESWEEFQLTRSQLAELSQFLSVHQDVLTGDSFFSIAADDRKELGLNMCGAAKMTCAIMPDGSVYPCAFLHDRPFLAGNVRAESLQSIWDSATIFLALRTLRVEACASCPRLSICHGGCPAVAFFLKRSLDHPDPECLLGEEFGNREASTKGTNLHRLLLPKVLP